MNEIWSCWPEKLTGIEHVFNVRSVSAEFLVFIHMYLFANQLSILFNLCFLCCLVPASSSIKTSIFSKTGWFIPLRQQLAWVGKKRVPEPAWGVRNLGRYRQEMAQINNDCGSSEKHQSLAGSWIVAVTSYPIFGSLQYESVNADMSTNGRTFTKKNPRPSFKAWPEPSRPW